MMRRQDRAFLAAWMPAYGRGLLMPDAASIPQARNGAARMRRPASNSADCWSPASPAAQAHPPASPTTSGVAGHRALHDIRDTIFAEPALAEDLAARSRPGALSGYGARWLAALSSCVSVGRREPCHRPRTNLVAVRHCRTYRRHNGGHNCLEPFARVRSCSQLHPLRLPTAAAPGSAQARNRSARLPAGVPAADILAGDAELAGDCGLGVADGKRHGRQDLRHHRPALGQALSWTGGCRKGSVDRSVSPRGWPGRAGGGAAGRRPRRSR
jgi:hypothetical protein